MKSVPNPQSVDIESCDNPNEDNHNYLLGQRALGHIYVHA